MTNDKTTQPAQATRTPSSHWAANGETDPHAGRYDCERAALALGHLTDDELANGAFLNYDQKLDIVALISEKPGYYPPIAWMTAVKDRIRWLSRALGKAAPQPEAQPTRKSLTQELQEKCSSWGAYWRASDAHGVDLSIEQAIELLQDALGVEVSIAAPSAQAEQGGK